MADVQRLRSSHWRHLLSSKVGVSQITLSTSTIGDVATTVVEVTFTANVNAADYTAGPTIKANSVTQTINSATRQANPAIVHYTLSAALDVNDSITWEYDDDLGDYQDDYGLLLADVTATSTTNYIGSHLYFDTADDAVWIGAA